MIEAFTGKRARDYDQFVSTWIPGYESFMELLPTVLSALSEGGRLLVAGCGTGNEILSLSTSPIPWHITGVDPSPEMLAQARRRLEKTSNVELLEGTVDDLPNTASFDGATLLLVLHFMPDDGTKLKLLSSIAQRLKPGAPFVLLDITGSGQALELNLKLLAGLLPATIGKEERLQRINRIQNQLHSVSESRLKQLHQQAGFSAPVRFFQNTIYQGWLSRVV